MKRYLSLMVCVVVLFSCQQNKRNFVSSYERFVEKVENNASSYSEVQWEQNDDQLNNYIEKYRNEKKNLSYDDKKKVGELTARYLAVRIKYGVSGGIVKLWEWKDFVEGFISEIREEIDNFKQ